MVWGNYEARGARGVLLDVRPFRVLMVCTGNTCRSPIAEAALREALRGGLDASYARLDARGFADQVMIRSAGTLANDGSPMTPEAVAACARLRVHTGGVDGAAHRSHRLTASDISEADLVLGMTREHRDAVIALEPHAARMTFTLAEFVRVATAPGILVGQCSFDGEDFAALLRSLVGVVAAARGYVAAPNTASDLDIEDPFGGSGRVYARVGSVISTATSTLASTLVGIMHDR
ncbi:MAG TPA: low molecular weight phosphatase family protein [Galbitalea sp.]|jgi:protein-tyrosine phosphatase